jgi:antitoxin component YwqK of YwqJK toxin-antitoxin module
MKFVYIVIFCFGFFRSLASCFDPEYTITEILASREDKHHIFTCTVLSTFNGPGGYNSIAVVEQIFRGTPVDTIYIVTGGNTTQGGKRITPGTQWLIISQTEDHVHYTATICHQMSRRIDDYYIECEASDNKEGKFFLNIITQFFQLEKSGFSGQTVLKAKNELYAEAQFYKGKAHGRWKHYSYSHELNETQLISEFDYVEGLPEGNYIKYIKHATPPIVEFESYKLKGLLQREKWYGNKTNLYSYSGDTMKIQQSLLISETGDTLRNVTTIFRDYQNEGFLYINYKHGHYYNIADSSQFQQLCEGFYVNGARVGKWVFYNKNKEVVQVQEYTLPDTKCTESLFYDDDSNILFEGHFRNGRRTGRWKQYYNGILENEWIYNTFSDPVLCIRYYIGGGKLVSPYLHGKIHGQQMEYSAENKIQKLNEFRHGIKHGKSLMFNPEGNVVKESVFQNNRETTLSALSGTYILKNGFLQGYQIRYSAVTGRKISEGAYDTGFAIGKHVEYWENGRYAVYYYPEDISSQMLPCSEVKPLKTEFYSKEGVVISFE